MYLVFAGTDVSIRTSGCRYLGGSIGNEEFCTAYIECLAEKWCTELNALATIAETQPHAAYTVFVKGITSKWRYHIRTTNGPPDVFKTLDDAINSKLLPALTGRQFTCDSAERKLLTLPARLGGIAFPVMSDIVCSEREASKRQTKPFDDLISPAKDDTVTADDSADSGTPPSAGGHDQGEASPVQAVAHTDPLLSAVSACKHLTRDDRAARRAKQAEDVVALKPHVSDYQRRLLAIASKNKGVSSWLTTEPTFANGTVLNKSDFRDAMCLRFGFPLDGMSSTCVCGNAMTVDHALTCPCGGYMIARHNEVRDCIAEIAETTFSDVEVEPVLLPFENESLRYKSANRSTEARLDIKVRGFWTRQQEAFFDIRVTHPKAELLTLSEIQAQLVRNEQEKKRQYCQRVVNIDQGVFTPLVFSTSGVIGRECDVFLKTLASEICSKHKDLRYPAVMGAIRAKLEFVILRWNITCLRGSRRSYTHKRSFLQECRMHWQVKKFGPYLSSFSPPPPPSLSLSLSLSPLSLSPLSLSLELSVGLTMYQFVRYGGDLCRLFSLLFCYLQ